MRRLRTSRRFWRWAALFGICWGLTPILFRLADMERGYDATGGEALIPLIPIIALVMVWLNRKSV